MAMHRFFVPSGWLQRQEIVLTGPLAHQLSRVLRLRPGDRITLLDDSGWATIVELDSIIPARTTAHRVSRSRPPTEPHTRLLLYQALPKGKKFDWILQKGTELGVSAFVPLITDRCIIPAAERIDEGKLIRWRRIVTEAAEQSGRTRLPQVLPAIPFSTACTSTPANTLALIACVAEEATPFSHIVPELTGSTPQEIRVFVGPEGGFTLDEVRCAHQAGIIPVSLGPRILRTETAALVVLAILLHALGELG